jgi:hypothetical protein
MANLQALRALTFVFTLFPALALVAAQPYEPTASGEYSTLFKFDNAHGNGPDTNLVLDSSGNLYGTTPLGGNGGTANGGGVLYEITP